MHKTLMKEQTDFIIFAIKILKEIMATSTKPSKN